MSWKLRLPRGANFQLKGGGSARLVSFFPILAWDGSGWAIDPPLRKLDCSGRRRPPRTSMSASSPPVGFVSSPRAVKFAPAIGARKASATSGWPSARSPSGARPSACRSRYASSSAWSAGRATRSERSSPRRRVRSAGITALRRLPVADVHACRHGRLTGLRLSDDRVPRRHEHHPGSPRDGTPVVLLIGRKQPVARSLAERRYRDLGAGRSREVAGGDARRDHPRRRPRSARGAHELLGRRGFEKLRLGVYVQTVQALAELGDSATVDCALRQFVVQNAYRTAVPRDLLSALQTFFPDAEQKLSARGARFGP